jgi:hypothetical protein
MSAWLREGAGALGLLFALNGAFASTPTARLDYMRSPGAEACPDAQAVRNAITARLGYDPFRDPPAVLIIVEVSKAGAQLSASVRLVDARGNALGARELSSTGDDCSELAASLCLALSIAIDPLDRGRSGEAFEPTLPKHPARPLAPQPPPLPAPKAEEHRATDEGWPAAWLLSAGPVGSWAVAPSLSAGFTVEARARWSHASLGLELRADVPTAAALLTGRVSSALFGGALSGCFHYGPMGACGVFSAGALRSTSADFTDSRTVFSPHAAAGVRAAVEATIWGRWSVRATADLQFRLVRITLLVNDVAGWVSPPAFVSMGLSAVAKLP